MTEMESCKDILFDAQTNNTQWNYKTDSSLKTIVLLLLFVGVMSQSALGYYAADYYEHSPAQNSFSLEHFKAHGLERSNKNIMGIDFTYLKNLIMLDCKQ